MTWVSSLIPCGALRELALPLLVTGARAPYSRGLNLTEDDADVSAGYSQFRCSQPLQDPALLPSLALYTY